MCGNVVNFLLCKAPISSYKQKIKKCFSTANKRPIVSAPMVQKSHFEELQDVYLRFEQAHGCVQHKKYPAEQMLDTEISGNTDLPIPNTSKATEEELYIDTLLEPLNIFRADSPRGIAKTPAPHSLHEEHPRSYDLTKYLEYCWMDIPDTESEGSIRLPPPVSPRMGTPKPDKSQNRTDVPVSPRMGTPKPGKSQNRTDYVTFPGDKVIQETSPFRMRPIVITPRAATPEPTGMVERNMGTNRNVTNDDEMTSPDNFTRDIRVVCKTKRNLEEWSALFMECEGI